jgi:hypothetical protein
VPKLIDTCRELRGHMLTFSKSPMLALNPRGKRAFELTEQLLTEIEDLADRVTLLEMANASSTLTLTQPTRGAAR